MNYGVLANAQSCGFLLSISTRYFLKLGYAVIFLHRASSLTPYNRHFSCQPLMDWLATGESGPQLTLQLPPVFRKKIESALQQSKKVMHICSKVPTFSRCVFLPLHTLFLVI